MESEETPQGAPDPVLMVHVEPLIDEVVQGLHVRLSQGHAETFLIVFIRQRKVHLWYYLTAHKSLIRFSVRTSAFVVCLRHHARGAPDLYLTDFLDQLRAERLYPMASEEKPQGVPDCHLVFHVDPLIYKVIQGFYVNPRESQTDTKPSGVVNQFTSNPS